MFGFGLNLHYSLRAEGDRPLCGFLYMGLSMGTGSCIWDARPATCPFAYESVPLIANGVLSQPAPGGEFTN